jgi:hypothetical protein
MAARLLHRTPGSVTPPRRMFSAKEIGRPSLGGPSALPDMVSLGYAIQKGLFISRCASQRVIPMSRKVASLNPSSSRRERARRCHSAMRNFSWSQRGRGVGRKVVPVMVLMTGSMSGNGLLYRRTVSRKWELRCDHEHNLVFFAWPLACTLPTQT